MNASTTDRTAVTLPGLVEPGDRRYALEVLTVKQAALYLGVSVTKVYRELGAGRIGCRRDGRRSVRFSQADLDAWRAAKRVEVATTGASVAVLQPLPRIARPRFR